MRINHRSRRCRCRCRCHHHCHRDPQDDHSPELAGAIFMCNNNTRQECFSRGLLGLPACREPFVRQVRNGMYLFLFDTDDREMYGVFKATSNGGMNIVPDAYISSGSTYPAQVQFEIIRKCKPLKEAEFKPAIKDKYFTKIKFNMDLNIHQVRRLLVLFEAKKDRAVARSITERLGPRSSSDLSFDRCSEYQQHDDVFDTHDTSETIHRHFRNCSPNTEASVLVMNLEDVNVVTPRNIPPHLADKNAIRCQSKICHPCNTSSYQYPNDPAQEGVLSSSSTHLAVQQGQFGCCNGIGNCMMCTQKMETDMVYSSLVEHTPCGLHADNHLSVSPSQDVQIYASGPPYPENTVRKVSTLSNTYDGSQLKDHVSIGRLQLKGVKQKKSVFLRLAPNPQRTASVDTEAGPDPAVVANGMKVDPTASVLNSTAKPDESELRLVTFERRNGGSKVSIELKGARKKRKFIRNQPMDTDTDAAPEAAVVADGMEANLTSPVSSSTMGPGETELPFVNFNRRKGGGKLSIELKGDSKLSIELKGDKKRRFIRPSLELKDEGSQLQVFEGPMHKLDIYFDKQHTNPTLVSSKSSLNRESMAVTDDMDVVSRVDGGTKQVLQGSICKSTTVTQTEVELEGVTPERFHGDHDENKVLLYPNGMGKGRGNLELGMNCEAELSAPSLGQCRHESNESLVSVEIESKKQKHDIEVSQKPLFNGDTLLEKLPEKSNVEPGHESVSSSDGPQMILVSGSEKLDIVELVAKSSNKTSANFSEGQAEFLVLGEKTEKKLVSSPEPMALEPTTEIRDDIVVEPKPELNLGLYNGKNNQVEDIAFESQTSNSKTGLISHKKSGNPDGDHLTLEPEANELEIGLFSLCKNSNPVEDYIAFVPNAYNLITCVYSPDENSKETVKCLEIAEDYIPLD